MAQTNWLTRAMYSFDLVCRAARFRMDVWCKCLERHIDVNAPEIQDLLDNAKQYVTDNSYWHRLGQLQPALYCVDESDSDGQFTYAVHQLPEFVLSPATAVDAEYARLNNGQRLASNIKEMLTTDEGLELRGDNLTVLFVARLTSPCPTVRYKAYEYVASIIQHYDHSAELEPLYSGLIPWWFVRPDFDTFEWSPDTVDH